MKILLIILSLLLCQISYAQYTLKKLTQQSIIRTKTPKITAIPKQYGDTLITVYSGGSVEILKYFVDGQVYDTIFSPYPTGLYLNGQHFNFYCDPDKINKQSVSNIADIYEFTFLNRNYLCTFTLREQNLESKYKCYNLFDITNVNKITQVSFSSIHVGDDSFGDFNADNIMDFVTVINRKPESFKQKITGTTYMIRVYTINNDNPQSLVNDSTKLPHYIYALSDENMDKFQVLQCDWLLPLQDSIGKLVEKVPYVIVWTSVSSPQPTYIKNFEGQKIEKNKYSVLIGRFDERDGADAIYRELKSKKIDTEYGGIFVIPDQYAESIKWLVCVGNYATKPEVQEALKKLRKLGYVVELKDLRSDY